MFGVKRSRTWMCPPNYQLRNLICFIVIVSKFSSTNSVLWTDLNLIHNISLTGNGNDIDSMLMESGKMIKISSSTLSSSGGIKSIVPTNSHLPTYYPTYYDINSLCVDDPFFRTTQGRMSCYDLLLIVLALPCEEMELIRFTKKEVREILERCPRTCNACPDEVGISKKSVGALDKISNFSNQLGVSSSIPSSIPNTLHPTLTPSRALSQDPTHVPSERPSKLPSIRPNSTPTLYPSRVPNTSPSSSPDTNPSSYPSHVPSNILSHHPSKLARDILPITPPKILTTIPSHTPSKKISAPPNIEILSPSIQYVSVSPSLTSVAVLNADVTSIALSVPSIVPSIGSSVPQSHNPNATLGLVQNFPYDPYATKSVSSNIPTIVSPLHMLNSVINETRPRAIHFDEVTSEPNPQIMVGIGSLAAIGSIAILAHLYMKRMKESDSVTTSTQEFRGQAVPIKYKNKRSKDEVLENELNFKLDQLHQISTTAGSKIAADTESSRPTSQHQLVQIISPPVAQAAKVVVPFREDLKGNFNRAQSMHHQAGSETTTNSQDYGNSDSSGSTMRKKMSRSATYDVKQMNKSQYQQTTRNDVGQVTRAIDTSLQLPPIGHFQQNSENDFHQNNLPHEHKPSELMDPAEMARNLQKLQTIQTKLMQHATASMSPANLPAQRGRARSPSPRARSPSPYRHKAPKVKSRPSSPNSTSTFRTEDLPASLRIRSMSPKTYNDKFGFNVKKSRTMKSSQTMHNSQASTAPQVLNNEDLEEMNSMIQHMSQLLKKLPVQQNDASECESMLNTVQDIKSHTPQTPPYPEMPRNSRQPVKHLEPVPLAQPNPPRPFVIRKVDKFDDNTTALSIPASLPSQFTVRRNRSGDISEISGDEVGSSDSSWKRVQFDW